LPDGGVTLRAAGDVLADTALTPMQVKVLDALKDIAGRDGATKTAWRAACGDVNERTFYKVANLLEDRRCVVKVGSTHFRLGGGQ
jgi:hypothetical protein